VQDGTVHSGDYAIKMQGYMGSWSKTWFSVVLKPNQRYTFTMFVRVANMKDAPKIGLMKHKENKWYHPVTDEEYRFDNLILDDKWHMYTITFDSNFTDLNYQFCLFEAGNITTAYIDDVYLFEIEGGGNQKPPEEPPEVIDPDTICEDADNEFIKSGWTDKGFESGVFEGTWAQRHEAVTIAKGSKEEKTTHSGEYALKMSNDTGNWARTVYQITLQPYTTYTFTMFARGLAGASSPRVGLMRKAPGDKWYHPTTGEDFVPTRLTMDGIWHQYTMTFTTNGTDLVYGLLLCDGNTAATVYVDDLYLFKVGEDTPEPNPDQEFICDNSKNYFTSVMGWESNGFENGLESSFYGDSNRFKVQDGSVSEKTTHSGTKALVLQGNKSYTKHGIRGITLEANTTYMFTMYYRFVGSGDLRVGLMRAPGGDKFYDPVTGTESKFQTFEKDGEWHRSTITFETGSADLKYEFCMWDRNDDNTTVYVDDLYLFKASADTIMIPKIKTDKTAQIS